MSTYLERHLEWLDAEFAAWDHTSDSQRVYRTAAAVDRLKLQLCEADAERREQINATVAALEASIADFGF